MPNRKHSVKQEKRTVILQAARQVFARKGYEPATLEAVAREAGLAKGTLYLYFKNKEDLYFHTLLHLLESLQACIQGQAGRSAGALDKMRAIAVGQFDFFIRHRDALQLFAPFTNPSLARLHKRLIVPMMERWTEYVRRVTDLVEEGQGTGALRRDIEPRDIALSFIGMTNQAAQALVRFGPAVKPDVFASAKRGVLASGPRASEPHESPEQMADTILRILMEGVSNR
jgi:TetR/AcrR family fatty acid metabolism transcriptional regulator